MLFLSAPTHSGPLTWIVIPPSVFKCLWIPAGCLGRSVQITRGYIWLFIVICKEVQPSGRLKPQVLVGSRSWAVRPKRWEQATTDD